MHARVTQVGPWWVVETETGQEVARQTGPGAEHKCRVLAARINGEPDPEPETAKGTESPEAPAGVGPESDGAEPVGAAVGPWAGEDRPRAGRVYDLTGLSAGGVADDVTDRVEAERREARARKLRPSDDPSSRDADGYASWRGVYGAKVETWHKSGRAYVAFPSRPPASIRRALYEGGFRWQARRVRWAGKAAALPEGLRDVGGAS